MAKGEFDENVVLGTETNTDFSSLWTNLVNDELDANVDEKSMADEDASIPMSTVGCFGTLMAVVNKLFRRERYTYIDRFTRAVGVALQVIEQNGLSEEGIYRKAGTRSAQRRLEKRLRTAIRRGNGNQRSRISYHLTCLNINKSITNDATASTSVTPADHSDVMARNRLKSSAIRSRYDNIHGQSTPLVFSPELEQISSATTPFICRSLYVVFGTVPHRHNCRTTTTCAAWC